MEAPDDDFRSDAVGEQAEVFVFAIPGGWSVTSTFSTGPLVFQSGARAEVAGRQLADAAIKAGLAVELRIQTRDGRACRTNAFPRRGRARLELNWSESGPSFGLHSRFSRA
jgi:hypothetical protein